MWNGRLRLMLGYRFFGAWLGLGFIRMVGH
jgi:hypothetical protein